MALNYFENSNIIGAECEDPFGFIRGSVGFDASVQVIDDIFLRVSQRMSSR